MDQKVSQNKVLAITKNDLENKLLGAFEPKLAELGYRILDLDAGLSKAPSIRIFLERLNPVEGQPGILIEDCAKVSRFLNPLLETMDFGIDNFELEVSSPGVDRRLRLDQDFAAVIGETVELNLIDAAPEIGAKFKGDLVRVEENNVIVGQGKKNRKEFSIPFSNIKKANRVWDFEKNIRN